MSPLLPSLLLALSPGQMSSELGASVPTPQTEQAAPSGGRSSSTKGGRSSSTKGGRSSSSSGSKPSGSKSSGSKPSGSKSSGSKPSGSKPSGSKPSGSSSSRPSSSGSSSTTKGGRSGSSSSSSRPSSSTPTQSVPAQPQSGGTNSGSHMPGNHGDAEATRPSTGPVNPGADLSPTTPGRVSPAPSGGRRDPLPSTGSTSVPSTSGSLPGTSGGRQPGASGATAPGAGLSPSTPSAGAPESNHMPGNRGGAEATQPGSRPSGSVPSSEVPSSSWGGEQSTGPGNSPGTHTQPSTGQGSAPGTGGHGRPSTGQGGSGQGAGSGQGSGSQGGHTRPSTGSGQGGGQGGHARPSTGNGQGGHARPSTGAHQRPSTPGAQNHPYRPHHTRPTTHVHNWYYGSNRGPVVNHYHNHNVYWYHGVWVYGPRPVHHVYYNSNTSVAPAERPELPARRVNRNDALMLGVHGAQLMAGYDGGGSFVDPGLGLSLAYRPVETFGVGLDYSYFNPTMDTEGPTPRETANISPYVSVHATPWSRVSPYAKFGVTASRRLYEDDWSQGGQTQTASVSSTAFGPSVGVGLEVAIGKSLALDLGGKYIGYMNVDGDDPSAPSALQLNAGMNLYF